MTENQCDGCKLELPIEDGIHVNPKERGHKRNHMVCTKANYEKRARCDHSTEYHYFHPYLIGSMRFRCRVCDGLEND